MAKKMDRNLALEVVRVTEAAALASSRLMGRGDEKAADQAAVDAMRRSLNGLACAKPAYASQARCCSNVYVPLFFRRVDRFDLLT